MSEPASRLRPRWATAWPVAAVLVLIAILAAVALWQAGLFAPRRTVIHPPPHPHGFGVPASLKVTNGPGDVLITPEQAAAAVRAWWPLEEQALAQNDVTATDALTIGPAQTLDDGVSADNLARGGNLRRARPLQDLKVLVPERAAYPGYFLAEVLTTTYGDPPQAWQELLVFVRPQAGVAWKVALDTGLAGKWPAFTAAPAAETGYAAQPEGEFAYPPERVPQLLADYDQAYVERGRASALSAAYLEPGYWTTTELRSEFEDVVNLREQDIVESWQYSVAPEQDGLYQFAVARGAEVHALVCFNLRYRRELAGLGRTIKQDGARDNWGGWLAPGQYSSISLAGIRQTCVLDPPQGRLGQVAANGGLVSAAGSG